MEVKNTNITFNCLPDNVKQDIFYSVPTLRNIANIMSVCKEWQVLVTDDYKGREIMRKLDVYTVKDTQTFSECFDSLKGLYGGNFLKNHRKEIEIIKKENEKKGGNFIDFLKLLEWHNMLSFNFVDKIAQIEEPTPEKISDKKRRCTIQ